METIVYGLLSSCNCRYCFTDYTVHAESKQYWTESAERVGIIEKVMNDGSIGSTFNEGYMKVEGETAYCIDINTCLLYTSPSPRDRQKSRMPSSA